MLDSLMEFVKVGNAGKFHTAIYHKLLRRAIVSVVASSCSWLLRLRFFSFTRPCLLICL